MEETVPNDMTPMLTALETRKAELTRLLDKFEHALDREKPKDWEDLATEREDDEVIEELGHHGLAELRQIEAALDRAAAGRYGLCVRCGSEIGAKRLTALPATPLCINCA